MKKPFALVTDSASNLSPEMAESLGIRVVPGSFAFENERLPDTVDSAETLYRRMAAGAAAPRVFGPAEQAWTEAFRAALEGAEAVLCLVTPFDVSSAFTTASAAMLAIQFEEPGARIKIVNPGVGSAGLASMLATLATAGLPGLEAALEAVEHLEPRCDSVFAPRELCWIEASGRLRMIEERLGALDGALPLLRVGTRMTGVGSTRTSLATELAAAAVKRAGRATPVNATIAHAAAPELAAEIESALCEHAKVVSVATVPLTATIGAQLGPGAIGIGVAPAACEGNQ